MDEEPQPQLDAGLALLELAPRLTRFENAVLRNAIPPLTFRQLRILERVAQGRTTMTALGRSATITLPAISESVEVLVRKNLLERAPHDVDRRAVQLALTREGRQALASGQRLMADAAEQLLAGVPPKRRAELHRDIRRVIDRVTDALLSDLDTESHPTGH